jgi:phosphatidylglycerophosphatase C
VLARASLRFLIDRDRGALKGALIHAALGGSTRQGLSPWTQRFVAQLTGSGLYAEALQAIAAHRRRGDRLLLMSASPDLYVPSIAQALGFDEVICTEVRWRADGRLDGRLASANRRGEEKRRCLATLIARDAPGRVVAYGDSGSDLPHMLLAQQAFMVNPPARLAHRLPAQVQAVHWRRAGGMQAEP